MKNYLVVYEARKNDSNGNPRNRIQIFRIKKNVPEKIHSDKINVGYRSDKQAALESISEFENLRFSNTERKYFEDAVHVTNFSDKQVSFSSGANMDVASWRERQNLINISMIYV